MPSIDQWKSTWEQMGLTVSPSVLEDFDDLISRYSEPHRKYHTPRHLDECFAKLPEVSHLAEHPAEVEVALWFHDAIYDTQSDKSEARSAELASSKVLAADGSEESAARIAKLILATKHAAVPSGTDARIVVDVDLSILAASAGRFDEYEQQVREEYSWVPEFLFRKERARILKEFLTRPSIFNTQIFLNRYERQARANIERSIAQLGG
jgi:predicted metal-dependent HD superfamily phosphohydrolase